jgi:hypothetical protein
MTKRKRNPITTDALAGRLARMEERLRADIEITRKSDDERLRTRLQPLHYIVSELGKDQRNTDLRLAQLISRVEFIANTLVKDRELIQEVNAHLWQSQNRLNAVRDILVDKMDPTPPPTFMAWVRGLFA